MKTAISLPDERFARVEAARARLGLSRSEFFGRAAERWLRELDEEGTTRQIDAVLEDGAQDEDPWLAEAARQTAERTTW